MQQIINDDRHVWHKCLGPPHPPSQTVRLRVELPVLVRRDHGQVAVGDVIAQAIGQVGRLQQEGPRTSLLVVKERHAVSRTYQGQVSLVAVDVRVLSNLGPVSARIGHMILGVLGVVLVQERY